MILELDTDKMLFGGSDWPVKRRARMLDRLDRYISTHITDDTSLREWKIFGIADKTDKEVLEMAEDWNKVVNALFVFQGIVAGENTDEILTVKIGRFN